MDSEGKYDRLLRGSTPRAAAEMIRRRLAKGAGSDPVTYQEDARGFEFYAGGIPAARLQTYSGDPGDWHVDVYNAGRPFLGHPATFLSEWNPGSYRRARYAFAFHDADLPNMFTTKAVGNNLRNAPNKHASFKDDLNDGAQICAMLQRLFGGDKKRHVVQARFTVKFGSRRNGVPDRMYTTFWVEDKKLFEYRRDVEVKNPDGSTRTKTTLTQRIKANEDDCLERGTPCVSALARFHAKNGKAFFSIGALRRSPQMCDDLYEVFPQYAASSAPRTASPVKIDPSQFQRERAEYTLHAIYADILGADDTPHRRVRSAPRKAAVARTSREEKTRMLVERLRRQDADEAKKRQDDASREPKVLSWAEFLEQYGPQSADNAQASAKAWARAKGDKDLENMLAALEKDHGGNNMLYTAILSVLNGFRVNPPACPAASIGALIAPAFDGKMPHGDGATFANWTVTVKGAAAFEALSGVFDDARAEYKYAMEDWKSAAKDYAKFCTVTGQVREYRRNHRLMALDSDSEVGSDRHDEGYKGSFRLGGTTFVAANSYMGKYLRERREAMSSRQIEKAKKDKRDGQKSAVEAGRKYLADAEREEAKQRSRGKRRDARSAPAKSSAGSKSSTGKSTAGEDRAANGMHEVVPDELDVRKRSLGKNFDAGEFYKVCMDPKITPKSTLEKYAHKHVTFFEEKKWDYMDNKKIVLMLRAIKKRGLVLPADYQPGKPKKASKPRGQKKQHNGKNNSGAGNGAGRPRRGGYSRKNAPQTGSTSGLGLTP